MTLPLLGQAVWPDLPDYYSATAPHAETLAVTAGAILLLDCALCSWLVARLAGRWALRRRTVIALNLLIAAGFFVRMEICLQAAYWEYVAQRTVVNRPDAELIWRVVSWKSAPAKVPGELRILCLGDSSTSYWRPDAYPEFLGQLLRERFPGKNITIINGGVPGYTTYQGLRFLKRYGLECEPDVVLLGYGYHDACHEVVEDKVYLSDDAALKVRAALFEYQTYFVLRNFVVRLRHRGTLIQPRLTPRVSLQDYRGNLESILEVARNRNCRVAMVNMPHRKGEPVTLVQPRRPYYEVNLAFGRRHGLPVIDAWLAWMEKPDGNDLFVPKNANHLVPRGAQALARLIEADLIQAWPELFR